METFKVSYLSKRAFYKDHENDMCFAKIDRILNLSKSVDENLNVIKSLVSNHKSNILLMIHEQYFYEDYKYYIKDFEIIISECAKYLINSGYTSKFIEEIIL